jgi:predicted branched-subunit amino acid permease
LQVYATLPAPPWPSKTLFYLWSTLCLYVAWCLLSCLLSLILGNFLEDKTIILFIMCAWLSASYLIPRRQSINTCWTNEWAESKKGRHSQA